MFAYRTPCYARLMVLTPSSKCLCPQRDGSFEDTFEDIMGSRGVGLLLLGEAGFHVVDDELGSGFGAEF